MYQPTSQPICVSNRSCDEQACCYGKCTACAPPVDWISWGLVLMFIVFLWLVCYDTLRIPRSARIVDCSEPRSSIAVATIAVVDDGTTDDDVASRMSAVACEKEEGEQPPSYSDVHGRS